jgi:hypothetical protein
VFVFLDLASLGAYLDSGEQDPAANFNHPQAFAFLRGDPNQFRIENGPVIAGPKNELQDSWFEWQPNLGLIAHLDDAAGIYNPLLLQRYDHYWKAAVGRENTLYDLLNIKYLIAKKDAKVSAKFMPVFDGDPLVNIWLNQKALPRAFMVYQAKLVSGGDEAFDAIQQKDFDPMKTIVIESSNTPISNLQLPTSNLPISNLHLKSRSTNSLAYEITTDADGYLFVGETFYPGWRALLDGKDAPMLRADYLFRAVPVPAGTHTLQMIFDPWSWKLGVMLTGLGLVGLIVGWFVDRRNQRAV